MLTYADKMEVVRRHQMSAPVQTVPLARELGLAVFHVPNWPNDLSGKIIRDYVRGGVSGYAIYINKAHPTVRRRFTTAHEIAHFVLHTDLIGDGIADDGLYRSRLSNRVEAEANRLAADILMPWSLLNPMLDSGVSDPSVLAGCFNVSESAMSIRLGAPVFERGQKENM